MGTVSTITQPVYDGRRYEDLPLGVQRFDCAASVTGAADSSDQERVEVNFNPTSSRTFQPYVAISQIGIRLDGTTTLDVDVLLQGADWEKGLVGGGMLTTVTLTATTIATNRAGAFNGMLFLGRTVQATDGTVYIRTQERNGATMTVNVSGFISDRPFIPQFNWRA
jgi:hypothetical protein